MPDDDEYTPSSDNSAGPPVHLIASKRHRIAVLFHLRWFFVPRENASDAYDRTRVVYIKNNQQRNKSAMRKRRKKKLEKQPWYRVVWLYPGKEPRC